MSNFMTRLEWQSLSLETLFDLTIAKDISYFESEGFRCYA